MKIRSATYGFAFFCARLAPCFAHNTAVVVNKDADRRRNPSVKLRVVSGDQGCDWRPRSRNR